MQIGDNIYLTTVPVIPPENDESRVVKAALKKTKNVGKKNNNNIKSLLREKKNVENTVQRDKDGEKNPHRIINAVTGKF
jgi:hypothetical protein